MARCPVPGVGVSVANPGGWRPVRGANETSEQVSPERAALDGRFALGQRAPLIEGYQSLAETEPDAGLFRRLGICLAETGQIEPAKSAFRRAIAMDHSDSISKRRLSRLEIVGANRPKEVRRAPAVSRVRKSTVSHADAKRGFLRVFPLGFSDPKYLAEERGYKWDSHILWQKTLARPFYEALLSSGNHAEACTRLRRVISRNKLNLPSPFELMALNRLTTNAETQRLFAEHVYSLVFGNDFGGALDQFVLTLQRLNVKGSKPFTWPIVTLYPFIADPVRHMFVKPVATQGAAARLGFELNYKPLPNALTYHRVLELALRLMDDLKELAPRDLMDVQGFIWVTHSAAYGIRG